MLQSAIIEHFLDIHFAAVNGGNDCRPRSAQFRNGRQAMPTGSGVRRYSGFFLYFLPLQGPRRPTLERRRRLISSFVATHKRSGDHCEKHFRLIARNEPLRVIDVVAAGGKRLAIIDSLAPRRRNRISPRARRSPGHCCVSSTTSHRPPQGTAIPTARSIPKIEIRGRVGNRTALGRTIAAKKTLPQIRHPDANQKRGIGESPPPDVHRPQRIQTLVAFPSWY